MSVTLSRGTTSVTLTHGLDVERRVGRPESTVREGSKELPYGVDRHRAAADIFELSGEFYSATADDDAQTLTESLIRPPLGYDTLTLDFGGTYGMGTYSVVPDGSRSVRTSWTAGETGVVIVDTLTLRVVNNP